MNASDTAVRPANEDHKMLSKRELLEAIWEAEAGYRSGEDRPHDHRQYLSHQELEIAYRLTQRIARLQADARTPIAQPRR
jgi:hypothetical protein